MNKEIMEEFDNFVDDNLNGQKIEELAEKFQVPDSFAAMRLLDTIGRDIFISALDKAREEGKMTPQTINEVSEKIGFKRGYEAAIMDSKVIPDSRLEERHRIIQMIEGMKKEMLDKNDPDNYEAIYAITGFNDALDSLIEKLK